jgi:sialate O-acetylesterase
MRWRTLLAAVVLTLLPLPLQFARADVKPHALFTDGMVLQRQKDPTTGVPVWGTADPGEKVLVALVAGASETGGMAKTDENGKWSVSLPLPKAGGPYTMTISGKNQLTIKDVYVGEVWIASGQSNMEWPLKASADAEKHIKNSANPKIRLFRVPHKVAAEPQSEVDAKWTECGPETVKESSAVAYFFGRDLQEMLEVPIGLIETNWGGTIAEAWTPKTALEANADLKKLIPADIKIDDKKPNPNQGTVLYNGMIAPLLPYAIKGAIWYQGESNANRAAEYETLFPTLIQSWRTAWNQGDFAFLFVQLAPYDPKAEPPKEPTDTAWARLREAQRLTLKLPKTGMAVITDVGDKDDIHPKHKEPVGARLALAARAIAYGEKVEYFGPTLEGMKVEDNKAILTFKHANGGLVAKNGELTGFTIAGEDKKFYNAEATIQGDKVIVTCAKVAKPVAVRFGWANFPTGNLWNKDELPASPFRTDDWPMEPKPPTKK